MWKPRNSGGTVFSKQVFAKPGVWEVAEGVFLYTTRVHSGGTSGSNGPVFVYEVESARADCRGLMFAMDFTGSANIVLLPSPVAGASKAAANGPAPGGKTHSPTAVSGSPRPAIDRDGDASDAGREQGGPGGTESTQEAGRTSRDLGNRGLTAAVSMDPFCRTVVARIAMRNPKEAGAIKHTYRWELLDASSPAAVAATVRRNAARVLRDVRLSSSLHLAGDKYAETSPARGLAGRLRDIAKRCHMHGALYVDGDFPPTESSLGPSLAGRLAWRRPRDFSDALAPSLGSEQGPFGGYGEPHPDDVRPCTFAADVSLPCAIAALAERPELVRSVLGMRSCADRGGLNGRHRRPGVCRGEVDDETAAVAGRAGCFAARLCVGGIWREYIMDDFFPCFPSKGGGHAGLCLSRAHGPALWVSMLEKAYAKAIGSYSAALGMECKASNSPASEASTNLGRGETLPRLSEEDHSQSGTVARPVEVLARLTGAPFLHVVAGDRCGTGLSGWGGIKNGGEEGGFDAEELWCNVLKTFGGVTLSLRDMVSFRYHRNIPPHAPVHVDVLPSIYT